MKKIICIIIFLILLVVINKYCTSSYEIKYEVNNFNVSATFKNDRFYFEIKGKKIFNFDMYGEKRLEKKLIKSISVFESKDYYCIYPVIEDMNTYPLCYEGEENIDFHFIEDEKFRDFYKIQKVENKKVYEEENNFLFYNNLDKKTYIALWKYNGFYLMNDEKINEINLFKKDQYNNTLCTLINNYLLIPNYNQEHIFNKFILLNLKNGNSEIIEGKFDIDYDSYIAGVFNDNVYVFDNKNLNLYEINTKKKIVNLIGNEEKGYVKLEKDKFVKSSKNEYKKDKITYFNNKKSNYNYYIENGIIYKELKENEKINTLIFKGNNIKILDEFESELYFISDETVYEYTPLEGAKAIFYYFELNFNNNNLMFIYNQ